MPTEETVKAMTAWGWTVELDSARAVSKAQIKRKVSKLALVRATYIEYTNLKKNSGYASQHQVKSSSL